METSSPCCRARAGAIRKPNERIARIF
jgi:hypothetical protein